MQVKRVHQQEPGDDGQRMWPSTMQVSLLHTFSNAYISSSYFSRNCVENLFARNAGPCHVCGKTLRKNNFWEQVFDDPLIEKETHIRRRLRKVDFLHIRSIILY